MAEKISIVRALFMGLLAGMQQKHNREIVSVLADITITPDDLADCLEQWLLQDAGMMHVRIKRILSVRGEEARLKLEDNIQYVLDHGSHKFVEDRINKVSSK